MSWWWLFALQAILLCFKNVFFYFCSYSGDGSESLDKNVPVSVLCKHWMNTEFTGCRQLMVPLPKSSTPPPEWASRFWWIWCKIQPKYSLSPHLRVVHFIPVKGVLLQCVATWGWSQAEFSSTTALCMWFGYYLNVKLQYCTIVMFLPQDN